MNASAKHRDDARPRVSQVTWPRRPADRAGGHGRRPALVQSAVMLVVAALLRYWLGHETAGLVVGGLGIVVLLMGLFAPAAHAPVHRFGQWLGRAVGTLLVHLLLVPFFYLVITPGALLLRLQKRDPLHRGRRDRRHTYWIRRGERPRDENIDRQFLREDREARAELRDVTAGEGGAS